MYQFEHRVGSVGKAVWPEILPTAFILLPSLVYARICLSSDADIRVTLAVLEQDIVARLVLLDQVVLQQKSILLTLHNHVLDVCYVCYQLPGLERGLVLAEVAAYASLQVLGLTYIYHLPGIIQMLVHAGLFGYAL